MLQVTLFPLLPGALPFLGGAPKLTDGFPFLGLLMEPISSILPCPLCAGAVGLCHLPCWWGHCLGCGHPPFLSCYWFISLSSTTHAAPWHCFGITKVQIILCLFQRWPCTKPFCFPGKAPVSQTRGMMSRGGWYKMLWDAVFWAFSLTDI